MKRRCIWTDYDGGAMGDEPVIELKIERKILAGIFFHGETGKVYVLKINGRFLFNKVSKTYFFDSIPDAQNALLNMLQ